MAIAVVVYCMNDAATMALSTSPPFTEVGSPVKLREGESSKMEFCAGLLPDDHCPDGNGADGGAGGEPPGGGKDHVGGGGAYRSLRDSEEADMEKKAWTEARE
jgi:hypothetical protein